MRKLKSKNTFIATKKLWAGSLAWYDSGFGSKLLSEITRDRGFKTWCETSSPQRKIPSCPPTPYS